MKFFRYLAMAAVAVSMASCDDFFDTESPSAMDDAVFKSESQIQQVVAGIYNNFYEDKSYRNRLNFLIGFNSDIEYNSKTGAYEQLTKYNCLTSNAEVSKTDGKDPWGYLTSSITRATSVIEGILKNGDTKNPVISYSLGEAYFLRAFTTLEMVKLWGDIPVLSSTADFSSLKKDRNEAYAQIQADLKKAVEILPWSSDCPNIAANNVSRPSREAALALLARADLYYAGKAIRPNNYTLEDNVSSRDDIYFNVKSQERAALYKEAMDACKQLIDRYGTDFGGKFKNNYEDVFKELCQDKLDFANMEYLWVMPMKDGARGQFLNYNCPKSTDALKALVNNASGSTNAANCIVPTFIYDFEAGDARKWVTVAPFSWRNDKGSGVSSTPEKVALAFEDYDGTNGTVVYQKNQSIDAVYLGKYRVEWMSRDRNGNDDGIDFPVIRYADVLLMYAEAAIGGIDGVAPEGANAGLAQTCLDKVRQRAGLTSVALSMENIQKERAFELCGEGVRKFDLIRWGILKQKLVETSARLNNLNLHQGEFAATGDSIYFKYKLDDSYKYAGAAATIKHAYIMDKDNFKGLAKGEAARPAEFDENTGWVAKGIFGDPGKRELTSYKLYESADLIKARANWPIFQVNVSASDGTLWNDYGY